MRKLAAILLGGMLLFNWVGYRWLNGFMQEKASLQLALKLDRQQYDESQLISVKVPFTHLSYYNSSPVFERMDGTIEINGVPCQYVKRRMYRDSLEVLCIPDQKALRLRNSGNDYFKLVNGIERSQDSSSGKHPGVYKVFIADPCTVTELSFILDRSFTVVDRSFYFPSSLFSVALSTDERPPNQVS